MPNQQIILVPASLVALVVFRTALIESSLELNFFIFKCCQSALLALQQQLGDGMGLCQHLIIALLDVGHDVGAHTRHMTLGHGIALCLP